MADDRVPELVADLEDQMAACLLSSLTIDRKEALAISEPDKRRVVMKDLETSGFIRVEDGTIVIMAD